MSRPLEEIHASEARISWAYDRVEALKYGATSGSAELKVQLWNILQRHQIRNAITFHYSQLKDHPLWIPKDQRASFRWNQTTN